MKYFIGLAFLGIIVALAFAGVSMIRDGRDGKPKSDRMMRALAFRVGISVLLFLCLLGSYMMGWIKPTGIPMN